MARHEIVTELPGIFYRRPDPKADPYKEEGDDVAEGETIGLIEVMKHFQDVEADKAGKLVEYLVENESEVQAGQGVAVVDDGS